MIAAPPRLVLPASLLFALAACATTDPRIARSGEPNRDSRWMTAEEIRASGAANAWEAIHGSLGLSLNSDTRGRPAAMSMRGRSSFQLDDTPVVVVDGVRLMDLQLLRSIRARAILSIEITNGIEGTLRYGTGAGGGAIVIRTRVN